MLAALHQYVRQRPPVESALAKLVRGLGALESRLDFIQVAYFWVIRFLQLARVETDAHVF